MSSEISQPFEMALPRSLSQSAQPVAQRLLQLPAVQTGAAFCRGLQIAPHAPQLAGSWSKSVQEGPQTSSSGPQLALQTPPEQTSPASQALPHAPQFAWS